MRLALAQINPTIGDVAGNTALVLDAMEAARRQRADVVLLPEMALLGYPPRDLLLRDGVIEACEGSVRDIAAQTPDLLVVVGHPSRIKNANGHKDAANSASILREGRILTTYHKQLLPGYDVFDEDRYFEPGSQSCVLEHRGRRLGILICEDIWRARDVEGGSHLASHFANEPVAAAAAAGAEILLVLSASPFVMGKGERHLEQARHVARRHRITVALCNQTGANDDLIFDGRSLIVGPGGELLAMLPSFQPALEVIEMNPSLRLPTFEPRAMEPMREIFEALRMGIRDYVHKTGHERAFIGMSGGVDSALTTTLAAAALGAQNLTAVLMPSRYTASMSNVDARALAANLGISDVRSVAIESMHAAFSKALADSLPASCGGVVEENIQSRIRGVILMAMSNAEPRSLVLATGNKSELAAGYTTLYGDMCGALAPLGDLLKTQVYELARWINEHHRECDFARPPIPDSSIVKIPTAELRPNQTDQDTLPPYDVLDEIIRRYIDHEEDVEAIIRATGFDSNLVRMWARRIDQNEYKRKQAAIILKVSPRSFGPGRPMPAAMKWDSIG